MKKIFYSLILVLFFGCSDGKMVYWCGDHPCINKKEKKAYFEKNMMVEVKRLNKKNKEKYSEIQKITQQAHINEKKRIKDEKRLAKELRLEEKEKIKEKKKLLKQAKIEEKKKLKNEKKLTKKLKKSKTQSVKKIKIAKNKDESQQINIAKNGFNQIVENIVSKNNRKSYPNINEIPD
ncbi:hypothetical protein OAJ18_01495 [Pelagibacteraceae bacterium]|nr:hypothetical protein [Pelagibacteraceae bacterium]